MISIRFSATCQRCRRRSYRPPACGPKAHWQKARADSTPASATRFATTRPTSTASALKCSTPPATLRATPAVLAVTMAITYRNCGTPMCGAWPLSIARARSSWALPTSATTKSVPKALTTTRYRSPPRTILGWLWTASGCASVAFMNGSGMRRLPAISNGTSTGFRARSSSAPG